MISLDQILDKTELVLIDGSIQSSKEGGDQTNRQVKAKFNPHNIQEKIKSVLYLGYALEHQNALTTPEIIQEIGAYKRKIMHHRDYLIKHSPKDYERQAFYIPHANHRKLQKTIDKKILLLSSLIKAVNSTYEKAVLRSFKPEEIGFELLANTIKAISISERVKKKEKQELDSDERLLATAYWAAFTTDIKPAVVTADFDLVKLNRAMYSTLPEGFKRLKKAMSKTRIFFGNSDGYKQITDLDRSYSIHSDIMMSRVCSYLVQAHELSGLSLV